MPTSGTQLTIPNMYIRNSKPNFGYVHPKYKTQFWICTSKIQNPILDNDIRNAFLYYEHRCPGASTTNVNCFQMFISRVFNNDFQTLASVRLKPDFWISVSMTTSAQTKCEKTA